jgi:hypothetical protein
MGLDEFKNVDLYVVDGMVHFAEVESYIGRALGFG